MNGSDKIRYQVMWKRLLAIVEEQAHVLIRTAFSTSTREAGDVSAGVFDMRGRMLAQAVTGTPGHINTMALAVKHFLEQFPVPLMHDGDIYITNDPWKSAGHLYDFTVVTPVFLNGKAVAMFACTSHVVDIGGLGMSPDSRQIYHEGLFIPICYLARAGQFNEDLLLIIRNNVREPLQVEGDVYALAGCNGTAGVRLVEMMAEFGLYDLAGLAGFILSSSREAMLASIQRLPPGTASHSMTIDGFDTPIHLVAQLTITATGIHVDYDGTSPASDYGINTPLYYATAYTAFAVKCVVAPDLPNNAATLDLIKVTAPRDTILNALHPRAVVQRSVTGQMVPDVVFGCFDKLLPNRVPAEGTSGMWSLRLGAGLGMVSRSSKENFNPTAFMVSSFHSGGTGARPMKDGLSATPFPSGVRNTPVEINEAITPLVIWRKEYRQDSGGAGRWRGGLGQVIEVASREPAEFMVFATFDRTIYPPRGRAGGGSGALGRVYLGSGPALRRKGRQVIPEGDRLVLEMPGGGGYGSAIDREPQLVWADFESGYVTRDHAREVYGVIFAADGRIDMEATKARRRELAAAK